jgi:hypothetical protein
MEMGVIWLFHRGLRREIEVSPKFTFVMPVLEKRIRCIGNAWERASDAGEITDALPAVHLQGIRRPL